MHKQPPFSNKLKRIYASNPAMVWATAWVSLIPSVGSLITLNFLYKHPDFFEQFDFTSWQFVLFYIGISSLLMGMALLPTTFLAILSGFLLSWTALPFLILGYTIATIVGYQIGKKLDQDSLAFLLDNYPKAAKLIADKKDDISQLIFFVRLSPIIPFAFSNLLFALLKVDLKKVVWVGLWGMLPRTLFSFSTGVLGESLLEALQEKNGTGQFLLILALVLTSGWGIYRFFYKKKSSTTIQ